MGLEVRFPFFSLFRFCPKGLYSRFYLGTVATCNYTLKLLFLTAIMISFPSQYITSCLFGCLILRLYRVPFVVIHVLGELQFYLKLPI